MSPVIIRKRPKYSTAANTRGRKDSRKREAAQLHLQTTVIWKRLTHWSSKHFPCCSSKSSIKNTTKNALEEWKLCSMTSCPIPGTHLCMPHQSRLGHDTLIHHYERTNSTEYKNVTSTRQLPSSLFLRTGVVFVHLVGTREENLWRQSVTSGKASWRMSHKTRSVTE